MARFIDNIGDWVPTYSTPSSSSSVNDPFIKTTCTHYELKHVLKEKDPPPAEDRGPLSIHPPLLLQDQECR